MTPRQQSEAAQREVIRLLAGVLPNQLPLIGIGPEGSPLAGSFNVVDRSRAEVLAQQTIVDVRKAIVSMRDNTGKIVRQTQALNLDTRDVNRLLAGATIEGRPRYSLRLLRTLIQKAAIDGRIVTVNTKTGVTMDFDPENYADLVYQTKSAETTTVATMERLQKRGINYVKVIGSNSANFCTTFVGKVFWIGPGEDPTGQFPSSRTLPRGGPPFHPRCTKRFLAFVLKLQSPEQIERAKLGAHQREFLGLDDRAAGKLYRARQAKRKAAAPPAAPSPADEPVTVLPATPGEQGERIIGPPDLLANAKDFLQRQTKVWAANITAAEGAALGRYQSYGDGYRRINGYLREGKVTAGVDLDALRRTIGDLDSAIAKGGVPFDLPVARAIRGNDKLLAAWHAAAESELPWIEFGFCSTSLTERDAHEFWGKAQRPVLFTFVVPALTPFAYPAGVTGKATHQLEVLLGRNRRFRIQSVQEDGKITRVEAELLP